jgi:hypothetical protein
MVTMPVGGLICSPGLPTGSTSGWEAVHRFATIGPGNAQGSITFSRGDKGGD